MAVGGDYMAMYRFAVPALPCLALLLAAALRSLLRSSRYGSARLRVAAAATVAFGVLGTLLHSTPLEALVFDVPPRMHGNYRGIQTERWHVARLTRIADALREPRALAVREHRHRRDRRARLVLGSRRARRPRARRSRDRAPGRRRARGGQRLRRPRPSRSVAAVREAADLLHVRPHAATDAARGDRGAGCVRSAGRRRLPAPVRLARGPRQRRSRLVQLPRAPPARPAGPLSALPGPNAVCAGPPRDRFDSRSRPVTCAASFTSRAFRRSDDDRPNPLRERIENTIRFLAVDAVERAGLRPPGRADGPRAPRLRALGPAPALRSRAIPDWPLRDRFVLSNGHASMLLYALLHLFGFDLSLDDLAALPRSSARRRPGHPEYGDTPGVEITTGPLGQGFAHGVGMALAGAHDARAASAAAATRARATTSSTASSSDGDLMEGISSEAARSPGHLGLGNLIYLYDDNQITIDGPHRDLASARTCAARFEAQRWHVQRVDGEDSAGLRRGARSRARARPSARR